jgi:RHS repeat-associated protein
MHTRIFLGATEDPLATPSIVLDPSDPVIVSFDNLMISDGSTTQTASTGGEGHYDFGARIYDARLGRWLSRDPKEAQFPSQSTYAAFNDNPVYFVDPDGKSGVAYKTTETNPATKRPILKVVSHDYIYGEGATNARAAAIEAELNTSYNRNGNYFTYTDKATGTVYDVVFEFKVETAGLGDALDGIREVNAQNNYYLVDDNNGGSVTLTGTGNYPGGNTGYLAVEDLNANQKTASHEKLHGFGGERHPEFTSEPDPTNDGTNPSMHLPSNQKYTDGTNIDPAKREVKQSSITNMLDQVTFDKSGKGNVGNPRRQAAVSDKKAYDVSR